MTIAEIKELIRKDETRTLELKKTTGELKEAMHTVCAFLNTSGGQLLFGIAPGPKWDPSRTYAGSNFFSYCRFGLNNAYRLLYSFAAYGNMREEKSQKNSGKITYSRLYRMEC